MNYQSDNNHTAPVKKAIRELVANEHIDKVRLDELMHMQRAVLKEEINESVFSEHFLWKRTAIAFTLVIIGLFVYQNIQSVFFQDYTRDIALEVVRNHIKLKPLDVRSQSFSDIKNYFTQLDFVPTSSSTLTQNFSLLEDSITGGRYCSIKGITAAQLRYQSIEGQLSTLYQVYYQPEFFGEIPDTAKGEKPLELTVKGLKVSMWVEKGLLMVLVK